MALGLAVIAWVMLDLGIAANGAGIGDLLIGNGVALGIAAFFLSIIWLES